MHKILSVALVLWLLVATQVVADTIAPYRSLCMIRTSSGQGSGTLIAKGQDGRGVILTCRHVASKIGDDVLVSFLWAGGGETCSGAVVRVVKGRGFDTDLAIVLVDQVPAGIEPRRVVRLDKTKGPWIAAGFRGGVMRVTHPILTLLEHPNGLVTVPAPFVGGMSGGALFDKYGNVVAVVVASDFATTGIAADGDNLHRMVDEFLGR